jgi:beta-lactam-binding protein with PASTA domain
MRKILCALLALTVGCGKKEAEGEAAAAPPAPETAPAPAAAPAPEDVPVPAASAEEVVVPDLKGKTVVEAIQALMDAGLLAKLEESREAKGATPGTILSQTPAAGQKSARLTVVSMVPADAPPPPPALVDIPSVKGKTVDQARIELFEKGFTPRVAKPVFTGGAPGKVVEQKPLGKAARGTEVLITPEKQVILVPDLRRQPVVDGLLRLRKMDLDWNGKDKEEKGVAPGTIVDQDPKPGANVDHDQVITLTLARGTSTPRYASDVDDLQRLSRKDVDELTRLLGRVLPKNYVAGIEVEPGPTALRRFGEPVEVSFTYATEHGKECFLVVTPYHDGKRVYGLSPMARQAEKDGQGLFKADLRSFQPLGDVVVDELRVTMVRHSHLKQIQLVKTSVPVKLRFTAR